MRQLHVLGLSADGSQLLLGTDPASTKAGYSVDLDSRLERIVRSETRRGTVEPTLAVKDIQAALRAGATPEQVAAKAGVPVSRIERYAGPVISEQVRIIDDAMGAYAVRARLGRSTLTLGDAVARSLGKPPADESWTVVRGADGVWVLRLALAGRGRVRVAAWSYHPPSRELIPLDAAAATLGHLERGRPAAAPRSTKAGTKPAAKPTGKKPTAKPTGKKPTAKPTGRTAAAKTASSQPAKRMPAKLPAKSASVRRSGSTLPAVRATPRSGRVSGARATPPRAARPR